MYYNPYNMNPRLQDDSAGIYVRVGDCTPSSKPAS